MKKGVQVSPLPTVLVLLCSLTAGSLLAQDAPRAPRKIQLTAADRRAAAESKVVYGHSLTTKTQAGSALRHSERSARGNRPAADAESGNQEQKGEGHDQLRGPGDLTFFGGPTVPFAESHPIFLVPPGPSCPANACWGDPNTFLADFAVSGLSHVPDPYVARRADPP